MGLKRRTRKSRSRVIMPIGTTSLSSPGRAQPDTGFFGLPGTSTQTTWTPPKRGQRDPADNLHGHQTTSVVQYAELAHCRVVTPQYRGVARLPAP